MYILVLGCPSSLEDFFLFSPLRSHCRENSIRFFLGFSFFSRSNHTRLSGCLRWHNVPVCLGYIFFVSFLRCFVAADFGPPDSVFWLVAFAYSVLELGAYLGKSMFIGNLSVCELLGVFRLFSVCAVKAFLLKSPWDSWCFFHIDPLSFFILFCLLGNYVRPHPLFPRPKLPFLPPASPVTVFLFPSSPIPTDTTCPAHNMPNFF